MKRAFVIAAGIMLALAAFFRFALIGYSFLSYCLAAAAVVALLYGFLLRRHAKKSIIALTVLLAMGFALFTALEIPIVRDAKGDRDVDADYIIVLGAGVNGSTPSLSMVNRLTPTVEYMSSHPNCIAIVSGGQGEGEDVTEARAMYDYLSARGVDGSRIIMEDKATSTEENLRYSFAIIGEELEESTVAVVSSEYHLHRAKTMASMLGKDVFGIPGRTSYPVLMINYFIREAFAMLSLHVFGL